MMVITANLLMVWAHTCLMFDEPVHNNNTVDNTISHISSDNMPMQKQSNGLASAIFSTTDSEETMQIRLGSKGVKTHT